MAASLRRIKVNGRRETPCQIAIESLEQRCLLTFIGLHELEVVGRAADGSWVASGFVWDQGTVTHAEELFAKWNPAANWTDVLHGDFDGDRLDDLAGRDAASGYWWASLADGTGSTTLLAGAWSNLTTWSDVAVVDLPNPAVVALEGLPSAGAPPDAYRDLIGRASDGSWWAAASNGDGTFRNVFLTQWNPAANWRDVLFFDNNIDGVTDIFGRASDGSWWAATSRLASDGTISYTNEKIASWWEAAGWRDVMYVPTLRIRIGSLESVVRQPAIVGRTSTGQWWAMRPDDAWTPRLIGTWNEAANWRDVDVLIGGLLQQDAIVGRTSTGHWYRSTFNGTALVSELIGQWDETAGWRNVQTVQFEPEIRPREQPNGILGQNAAGAWQLLTQRFSAGAWGTVPLGLVSGSAGWVDVQVGQFTREFVAWGMKTTYTNMPFPMESTHFEVSVYARRSGVLVRVQDELSLPSRYSISYTAPAEGIGRSYLLSVPGTLVFSGHNGADNFANRSQMVTVKATGRAGGDRLDSMNGKDLDELFAGPGFDVLLGDPGDVLSGDPGDVLVQ